MQLFQYVESFARYIGVSPRTVNQWIGRGRAEIKRLNRSARAKPRDSEMMYVRFTLAYDKALAQAELSSISTIKQASTTTATRKGDWRAAAWLLERRHPDRWGDPFQRPPVEANGVHVRVTEVIIDNKPKDDADASPPIETPAPPVDGNGNAASGGDGSTVPKAV